MSEPSLVTSTGMRRVVVTGMGIVSCLGNTLDEVSARLRAGRGGIVRVEAWRERGFASQVAGVASVAQEPPFERKLERFMGDTARFACHAARSAIADAGLDVAALRTPRAGAVIGSGVGAMSAYDSALAIGEARGLDRVPPYTVPQAMSSTTSANVAHVFGVEGVTYSPSSACTTSALAIGQAMQLIQTGRQALVLAGGSEALHDNMTLLFDAMGALSRGFNAVPERASRPYDTGRDGFVIASGAGVLVLESLEHALARGVRIYAELTGFGHCTDGAGMVTPHASGIVRAMRAALDEAGVRPDYINTHAPSTPRGDVEELDALAAVYGESIPPFSSTKGLTGHPPGACGAHEAIYTLLMMREGYMAGTAGIESLDARAAGLPLVRASRAAAIDHAMSVSFGFGGSCASLMFSAWKSCLEDGRTPQAILISRGEK
ncbi:beta-ketoacyl synthase N-terminal-like domain-containing protein [Paraburkholderia kururiensis]|uniref:beta-ketoacyl synthase N-terminal-like domain-containing protein n=1 Tax=Paraburkholderia kururiensis TaxID=984307 RepID=UPI0018F5052A|nr:beta-ketoacyl synthase N-terminal-like domain-containing protein [Paraburkholderia kururiensis]